MVQLTDVIIKGKTRCDRLDDVRNLNLWGQDITDVSILQRTPNMEVLSLSVNGITSLKHFMHCKGLKELYLRKNMVSDISDIRFLMPLPHLKVLWLSDNPCADVPNYRNFVIGHLPSLEKLDNLDVTPEERKAAQSIPLLRPATQAELLEEESESAAAPRPSSRPVSPSGLQQVNPSASAGQQVGVNPSTPQPLSSRARVPGGSAAVQGEPCSSYAASNGQSSAGTNSKEGSGYDATFGMPSQAGAGGANAAAESFAFSRQQYDPQRYSSYSGSQPGQQQQLQRPVAVGNGHMGASPNVLYAVMALLADLDTAGLSIVHKEVEQRLKGLRA